MTWAANHLPTLATQPNITCVAFTNSDSANTKKDLLVAGAANSGAPAKLVALNATSTETANARVAQLWYVHSATAYLIGSCNIPINSGFDGTVSAANILSLIPGLPTDNDGQVYIFVGIGDKLQVSLTTQVASGKEVDFVPVAADL